MCGHIRRHSIFTNKSAPQGTRRVVAGRVRIEQADQLYELSLVEGNQENTLAGYDRSPGCFMNSVGAEIGEELPQVEWLIYPYKYPFVLTAFKFRCPERIAAFLLVPFHAAVKSGYR